MKPFSEQQLCSQLRALGVKSGSVLVVHTSFRAIGPAERGPEGLIDALRAVLGSQGTLVMPSMTGRRDEPYDPATTPTRGMGIVAETFWRLPGVLRSDHPTSSFAAVGPAAARITAPQPIEPVHGLNSPIGRVYELDGDVLLLGVAQHANTMIHLAEAMADVPYRKRKSCVISEKGRPRRVPTRKSITAAAALPAWTAGCGSGAYCFEGTVGQAPSRLMHARDVVGTVLDHLQQNSVQFLCPRGSGCAECDEAWCSVTRRA